MPIRRSLSALSSTHDRSVRRRLDSGRAAPRATAPGGPAPGEAPEAGARISPPQASVQPSPSPPPPPPPEVEQARSSPPPFAAPLSEATARLFAQRLGIDGQIALLAYLFGLAEESHEDLRGGEENGGGPTDAFGGFSFASLPPDFAVGLRRQSRDGRIVPFHLDLGGSEDADSVVDRLAEQALRERQRAADEHVAHAAPRTLAAFEQVLRTLHAAEDSEEWGAAAVEGFHGQLTEAVPALALGHALSDPTQPPMELFAEVVDSASWTMLQAQIAKDTGGDAQRLQALRDEMDRRIRDKVDLVGPDLAGQTARFVLSATHNADKLRLASCLQQAWQRGPWAK